MKKIKSYIIWVGLICLVSYCSYKLFYRVINNHLLKTGAVHKKAVIIDEKNYMVNSPVSDEYSYSYTFIVNGKTYNNNSHNSKLMIGDSIEIEFDKTWPTFNRPAISAK